MSYVSNGPPLWARSFGWQQRLCRRDLETARDVLLLVLLVLLVSPAGSCQSNKSRTAPSDASELAQKILEGRWKKEVQSSPSTFRISPDMDLSTVSLRQPFTILVLRGETLTEYLASSSNDPREFPVIEKYCFPIGLADGRNVGAILIRKNRDENNAIRTPGKGEFVWFGFYLPNDRTVIDVEELRGERSDESEVYVVQYIDGGVFPRYLVQKRDGTLYSGSSRQSLRLLVEDAPSVRDSVRAFHRVLLSE